MKRNSRSLQIILITILLIAIGCQSSSSGDQSSTVHSQTDSLKLATAREAFLYGLPLVLIDLSKRQMLNGSEGSPAMAVNQFRHRNSFPDATFRDVVRPNADTYYSIAWLDLAKEPVVLSVPDTKGRYYMLPMIDAYSNVFASPGSRTTGNGAKKFLVTGPLWKGAIPAGMQQIASPTNTVWIIGRIQVNSKKDGDEIVVPLQNNFLLNPLSQQGEKQTTKMNAFDSTVPKGSPNDIVRDMPIEAYFNYLNKLLADNPPPLADSVVSKKIAMIGVAPKETFRSDIFSPEYQSQLSNLSKDIINTLKDPTSKSGKMVNGWSFTKDNVGMFGVDYFERARIAYTGLGANLPKDAIYPGTFVDSEGQTLDGQYNYVIHFKKGETPPANAFWSLTMYDMEGFMVANGINRNAIGDRSNLKINSDGSIDIHIQQKSPGKNTESNWLPAPEGKFNVLMRIYWPKPAAINGEWIIPPVQKKNKN
jgi:hypothetical protein